MNETKKQHQHGFICYTGCPDSTVNENYIGEIARRLLEKIDKHVGKKWRVAYVTYA